MLHLVDSQDKSLHNSNETERESQNETPVSEKAILSAPLNKAIFDKKTKSISDLHKEMSVKHTDAPKTISEMDKEDWDSCHS